MWFTEPREENRVTLVANGDIVTVSQTRGLLCQHWGSSGYMMVSANTSQGLSGFKAFWWWCRELKMTGYISRHRRQWRTLHLMFIIYDHSILRILRMSSWVTKWRWHFMFYFWEGEILSGFWWFWSWTWWIRARIKMMRRVTGGEMTTGCGSGLNILGGYFPISV